MSRVAVVISIERVQDDGGHGVNIEANPGGGANVTLEHYAAPGDDACPLAGDTVALVECDSSTGGEYAAGYADTKNEGQAKPGEKRIYARDASGKVVADIFLKRDGSCVITASSFVFEGPMTLKGDLTVQGAVVATGEVSAGPKKLGLTAHVHPTAAVGPPSLPEAPPAPP